MITYLGACIPGDAIKNHIRRYLRGDVGCVEDCNDTFVLNVYTCFRRFAHFYYCQGLTGKPKVLFKALEASGRDRNSLQVVKVVRWMFTER